MLGRRSEKHAASQPAMHTLGTSSTSGVIAGPAVVRPSSTWQTGGYRGERTELDSAEGVHQGNDQGYMPKGAALPKDDDYDPFHDRGVDPSLASNRSENLRDRQGGFWLSEEERKLRRERELLENGSTFQKLIYHFKHRSEHERWLSRILMTLTVVLALLLTGARWLIFNVTRVNVNFSNSNLQEDILNENDQALLSAKKEEIINESGIIIGMNSLKLDEEKVRENIEKDRYLIFLGMEKSSTHEVVLRIYKREISSYITSHGITYLVDRYGMVLDETSNISVKPAYVEADGLNVGQCMVGQKLSFADASQANVFKDMLLEIEVLGLNAEIEKVYFNDLDHLTLLTRDAFSVSLGSSERLHAKLRSMSLVLEQLRSLKSPAGTVDVSIPESPTYIPEKTI